MFFHFYLSRITKCSGWRRRLKSSAQSLSMYCDIKRNCRRHESGRSWGKCYIKNALGSNTKKYKYFNISNEYENAILLYLICRHCLKVQSAQLQCAQNTQITNCGTFRLVQKRTPSRPFNTYGKRLKRLRWVDTCPPRNYQYFFPHRFISAFYKAYCYYMYTKLLYLFYRSTNYQHTNSIFRRASPLLHVSNQGQWTDWHLGLPLRFPPRSPRPQATYLARPSLRPHPPLQQVPQLRCLLLLTQRKMALPTLIRGRPRLPWLNNHRRHNNSINKKVWIHHSLEISWFFCHWDFTWSQFWRMYKF